jgi:hypothetical protein
MAQRTGGGIELPPLFFVSRGNGAELVFQASTAIDLGIELQALA